MKQDRSFIGEIIERLTPVILRQYQYSGGRKHCPNSHLDAVALAELKREALRLTAEGRRDEAQILYDLIQNKPTFGICDGTWDVFWLSPIKASLAGLTPRDSFPDVLLFASPGAKEQFTKRYNEVIKRTLETASMSGGVNLQ